MLPVLLLRCQCSVQRERVAHEHRWCGCKLFRHLRSLTGQRTLQLTRRLVTAAHNLTITISTLEVVDGRIDGRLEVARLVRMVLR